MPEEQPEVQTVLLEDYLKLQHLLGEYMPDGIDVATEMQYVIATPNPEPKEGDDQFTMLYRKPTTEPVQEETKEQEQEPDTTPLPVAPAPITPTIHKSRMPNNAAKADTGKPDYTNMSDAEKAAYYDKVMLENHNMDTKAIGG